MKCSKPFTVPSEVIPEGGGRGRCTACGAPLVIFPDGRIQPAQGTAPSRAPNAGGRSMTDAPIEEALWEIQSLSPSGGISSPGPFTLADLKEKVDSDLLFEGDLARVRGGEWQPVRSYPALMQFFLERTQKDREDHGDEEHCVIHEEFPSRWWCPRCKDYLCERCVVTRPLVAGGADHYLCLNCETEVEPLRRKPALSLVPGFLKRS